MKKVFLLIAAIFALNACSQTVIDPMDEAFDDKPPKTNCGGAMCDEGD